jgi:hypothetical protein
MRGRGPVGGTVGPACMQCGSLDLEVTRPGWVEGLRDWLGAGGRWRPSSAACRRCGHVAVAGSEMYLVRRGGWWRVPVHLARALRRRRTMIPVPATYLLAAVVGVALGVCGQLVLGWAWWLVAAGVLAAVWLLFAASAFRRGGSSLPLATEVLMAVDPARALRRERRALAERFRAAPFPLYGLPASRPWPRRLGGLGSRQSRGQRPVVTDLSLAHGDPLAEQGPQLSVEVRVEPLEPGVPVGMPDWRERLAEDLWWTAAPSAHGGQPPPGRAVGPAGRQADLGWSEVQIEVDGRPVVFDLLAEGRHWVAHAELEGRTLVLRGRDLAVEEVELVRVTDVEPYVEGTRRLEAASARHLDLDH